MTAKATVMDQVAGQSEAALHGLGVECVFCDETGAPVLRRAVPVAALFAQVRRTALLWGGATGSA